MPALQAAFPLTEAAHLPVGVREHLYLDVARARQETLHQQGGVPEGGDCLPAGGGDGGAQVAGLVHPAHAFAPTARGRLQQDREADVQGRGLQFDVVEARFVAAGNHRHAGGRHGPLGVDLVAHQLDGLGGRADEGDPGGGTAAGEGRVLGQEAVARVDGVGIGDLGRGHDPVDVQVGRGATDGERGLGLADVARATVGLGEHGHAADAHGLEGPDDAHGDFAPVGDQDRPEHGAYIRNTP